MLSRLPLPAWLPAARALRIVELCLASLLLIQLARLLWLALTPVGPIGTPASASSSAGTAFRGEALFAPPAQAAVGLAGYVLHGVRTDPHGGAAIIAGPDKQQGAYRVGDVLASGIVLSSVGLDHVVLKVGGEPRRLELERDPALPPASPMPAMSAPTPAAAQPAPTPATANVDPARLLGEAGLRANQSNGRTDGYTVMPRGDGALLRQAGLQPGDVLLDVNGLALDPEHLPEVQQQLRSSGGDARITYRRDGQTRVLTLTKAP